MSAWTDHVARWKDCTACGLCQQRDRICLARGVVPADIVFIGEAPGASEDALGQPFVGPAGQLLDNDSVQRPGIIQYSIPAHIENDKWVLDVRCAFTNLVCCFPREAKERGDNEPEQDEIRACRPRLVEFVRLCRPKLIVLVGKLAAAHISGASMFSPHALEVVNRRSELDNSVAAWLKAENTTPEWIAPGKFLEFIEIDHPAYILRMPLAQKQMAVQRAIVTLRCAVADMLQ